MIDRIKQVMADTFVLEEDEISDTIAFGQIDEWDSMGHVHLISALEAEFGISFTMDETEKLGTIDGICQILQNKGVS